jgi:hypothetical protein
MFTAPAFTADDAKFSGGLSGYWFPKAKEEEATYVFGTGNPVLDAYRNLVSPQTFVGIGSTNHYYRSGGAPHRAKQVLGDLSIRYADLYRGLAYCDDVDIPATTSDLLAPGEHSGSADLANDYRAYGSAFKSPLVNIPGGLGFRNQQLATNQIAVPWYASIFFKTTRTSFDFFGAYQEYIIINVVTTSGDQVRIMFANSTQTNTGTVGRVRLLRIDSFTGQIGVYDTSPAITVNDGNWHHAMIVGSSTDIRGYIDGQLFATIAQVAFPVVPNGMYISNYYFDGFEGDLGFAAVGDATNVTTQRIRYLAATRTLKDRPVIPSSTAYQYAPHAFEYRYDDATASWIDAESKVKVWNGSRWVPNPSAYNTTGPTWQRMY